MAELNIDTSTAKGLEKVIGLVAKFIIKARKKTSNFFYGSKKPVDPNASKFKNALNKGAIKVLEDISDIDFCNIINYALNSVKLGSTSFNPEIPPGENASPLEKRLWPVQKKAYDYQKLIDKYYAQYGTATGKDSRLGLAVLIQKVDLSIDALLEGANAIKDPTLSKNFPEISVVSNFLVNAKKKIGQYSDVRTLPVSEVQEALKWISKFRQVLIAIQALNSPAALISTVGGGKLQEQLQKINELVDAPDRIIPRLKDLLKLVRNIISVATTVLRYINLIKTIVTIAIVLIRIFNIIKAFLASNPLPSLYTTLGITVTVNKTYQQILEEQGTKKLIKRLQQINIVLALMVQFVTVLLAGMNRILLILKAILMNLESCKTADKDQDSLQQDLSSTIQDLENTIAPLQSFLDQANSVNNRANNTFGEYTIEIVNEQLVDEGIALKRRYGIARDKRNIIVVQSAPTFASLDLIIINEVKVLLVSEGYVKTGINDMSSEDQLTIMEASKYVEDSGLSIENVLNTTQEAPSSSVQDISGFLNNLSGGKAFRDKVRSRMKQHSEGLSENMQTVKSSQRK